MPKVGDNARAVVMFLQSLGLSQKYDSVVATNRVDGAKFETLQTVDDWTTIGVRPADAHAIVEVIALTAEVANDCREVGCAQQQKASKVIQGYQSEDVRQIEGR